MQDTASFYEYSSSLLLIYKSSAGRDAIPIASKRLVHVNSSDYGRAIVMALL